MSDDLSKVDWTRQIEAVHENGQIFEARSIYGPFGPLERQAHCVLIGTFSCDVFDDGSVRGNSFWRIRNVAEVPRNSEAPSDAITLTADQAAMLRKVLTAIGAERGWPIGASVVPIPRHLIQEARGAAALLSEPVDADLVEARRIVCESVPSWNDDHRRACMQGEYDGNLFVVIARRALERDSREG